MLFKSEVNSINSNCNNYNYITLSIGRNIKDIVNIYCSIANIKDDLVFINEFLNSIIKNNLLDPEYICEIRNYVVNIKSIELDYYYIDNNNINISEINKHSNELCNKHSNLINNIDVKCIYDLIKSSNIAKKYLFVLNYSDALK